MDIDYTYEVVAVNEAAKCMEVLYKAEGHAPQHIGARLPVEGESLSEIIAMYSPLAYWQEQKKKTMSVAVGTAGSSNDLSLRVEALPLDREKALKIAALAAARYNAENSEVSVNGVLYSANRDARAALTTAQTNLQAGVVSEVNWKTASGCFVPFTAATIVPVVAAISEHVQRCFDVEARLIAQVSAAENSEALKGVVWPD
jgi:hypothetical protein